MEAYLQSLSAGIRKHLNLLSKTGIVGMLLCMNIASYGSTYTSACACAWATNTSWTPNVTGGPLSTDNVTVNNVMTGNPNLSIATGGAYTFNSNLTSSGTLTMSGGTLGIASGTTIFSGSTSTLSGGTITVSSGATLTLSGTTTLSGVNIIVQSGGILNLNGATTLSSGSIANSGTVNSSGGIAFTSTVNITGTGTTNFTAGTTTVSAGTTTTFSGSVNVSGTTTIQNNGTLTLNGSTAVSAGTIQNNSILNLAGSTTITGGVLQNNSTLNTSGGLTLNSTIAIGGTVNVTAGTLTVASTKTATLSGTINYSGSSSIANNGTLTLSGATTVNTTGTVTNSGTINSSAGLTFNSTVNVAGAGTTNLTAGTVTIASGTTTTFSGPVNFSGASVTVPSTGTLSLTTATVSSGSGTITVNGTLNTTGTLTVSGSVNPTITINGTANLNTSGTSSSTAINDNLNSGNSLTLAGSGNIVANGQLIMQNASTLNLNVNSSFTGPLNFNTGNAITANVSSTSTFSAFTSTSNGGYLNILTGGNLTISSAISSNNVNYNIAANSNLNVVGGMTLSNNGSFVINGLVTITGSPGNFNGGNSTLTGNGDITTTGSMVTNNGNTIFGANASNAGTAPFVPCNTGPCDGRDLLCGGNKTLTISPSSAAFCSGSSTTLTASFGGTATSYQWQSCTTVSGTYATISGATSSTYSISSLSSTTYYNVVIGVSGCSHPLTSGIVTVTVGTTPSAPTVTTPVSYCQLNQAASALSATVSSGGTLNWYGTNSSGGTASSTAPTPSTASAGTTNYYVSQTVTGCESSRAAIAVTVGGCLNNWVGGTAGNLTNWSTGGNWSTGVIPSSVDSVVITSSPTNQPSLTASVSAGSITNSGTLTINGFTLSVYGNLTNNGTLTSNSSSVVSFVGSSAQKFGGSSLATTLYGLTINNAAGVTLNSSLTAKGTISLPSGVLTTNNNLTINFGNGGNIAYNASDAGSVSGTVSGMQSMIIGSHYLTAPFAGATSAQVAACMLIYRNGYWLINKKNFTTQGWTSVLNTTTALSLGEGFSLGVFTAANLTMSGTYTHNLTFNTPAYSNTTAKQYFMVGNPYPSTVDWNSANITKNNINGSVYYWNASNSTVATYVSPGPGVNGGTNLIPAMQSVLVTTTGSGGTSSLSFSPLCRVTSNSSLFRMVNNPILMLEVVNSDGVADQTLVRFNNMASIDYESDVDAIKMMNPSSVPSLYTYISSENTNLAINTRPMLTTGEVIPLHLKPVLNGTYTIRCSQNTVAGYNILLVDRFKNTQMLVDTTFRYTINSTNKDSVNRFELRLAPAVPAGQQPVDPGSDGYHSLGIYSSPAGFLVQADYANSGNATIGIMDAAGRQLKTMSNVNLQTGNNFYSLDEYASGVYLIRVTTTGGSYVHQVTFMK